jgi:hypothetical protein
MSSHFNNTTTPLEVSQTWVGGNEITKPNNLICVSVNSSSYCLITIKQTNDLIHYDQVDSYNVSPATGGRYIQEFSKCTYCHVEVENVDTVAQTYLSVATTFTNQTQLQDSIIVSSGTVSLSTGSSTIGSVSLTPNSNVIVSSGTVSLSTGSNTIGSVNVLGQTPDYIFIPTVGNNTALIYADGIQGTNVVGGWEYNNTPTGKINWYLYNGNPTTAGQNVARVSSMYAVVNNLSTLGLSQAQNPWMMIYTRPDSGTNAASWYKSKLFFGSNAFTDINGVKLLYTGTDPIDIHPEITGNNRINLLFNVSLSTKSLLDAETESILYGTLQTTNNTATPSQFYFRFSEFGISWVQQSISLPIQDNSVVVSGNVNAKINPTASQAVRITGLGNTALLISTLGLCYGTSIINKSATTNCWVKFYIKSTAPTELDTPFLIQNLEYVAQYNLNSHNDSWFNMPIGSKLWARATLTSTDGDTTDAGVNAEATVFIGS